MKRFLFALALAALPVLAQNQDPNEKIQRLVNLKYVDADSLGYLLANFGVDVQADKKLKVVALSGPRNRVTTAEDAIKQLDVPAAGQKDIDLVVYFVVGSDLTQPGLPPGSPIPQDL